MVVRIVGDNSGLDKSIDNSQTKLQNFAKVAENTGKKLSTFVTLPILGLAAASLKAAASMESQESAFTTMLGSADKAKKLLGDLTKLAEKTPFQLTDLAKATKTMLAFGVANEQVLPNLKMLGDIAGGNAAKLDSLTLAFSQIQSTGRLMGQDLLQLINAGFNPLQVISQKTGETMGELKKRMEQGGVSAEEVAEAFKIATSEGGLFFNGMERASQTLEGQFSTLKDNVVAVGRSIGEILLPIAKEIVGKLTEWAQKFASLNEHQRKTILIVAGVAAAIGPVLLGIGKMVTLVGSAIRVVQSLTASLATLNIALGPLMLVGALVAAAGAMIALQIRENKLNEEHQKFVELTERQMVAVNNLVPRYEELARKTELTAEESKELARLTNDLKAVYPDLQTEINATTGVLQLNSLELRTAARATLANTIAIREENLERTRSIANINKQSIAITRSTESLMKGVDFTKIHAQQDALLAKDQRAIDEAVAAMRSAGAELAAFDAETAARIEEDNRKRLEAIAKTKETEVTLTKEAAETKTTITKEQQAEEISDLITHLEEKKRVTLEAEAELWGQMHEQKQEEQAEETKITDHSLDLWVEAENKKAAIQHEIIIGGLEEISKAYDEEQNLAEANAKKQMDLDKKVADQRIQLAFDYIGMLNYINDIVDISNDMKLQAAEKEGKSEEELAKLKRRLARDAAVASKVTSAFNIGLYTAQAVMAALTQPIIGPALAAFAALQGAIQLAIVLAKPLPALAEGGIVPARPGGTVATLGEAGQPEVVFPLDRLEDFLSPGGDAGDMRIIVNLDSRPLLDKIFQATRNRTVLIDQGAVV